MVFGNSMGNALLEQGELEEAIESYNKAIAINPDYAGAYNNMGLALYGIVLNKPNRVLQTKCVNKAIDFVKKGKVKEAEKAIKPAINFLLKNKCKKIILACTELPIAIFAYKSFKKIKSSKTFLDPNLILAKASMKKYKL